MNFTFSKFLIAILFTISISGPSNAQTYQFSYAMRADSTYFSANNVLAADEWGKLALSATRKALYSSLYFVGFQNKDFLVYTIDWSQLSGKTMTKTSEMYNARFQFNSETVAFPFDMKFSDMDFDKTYYCDLTHSFVCSYDKDTLISSKYYIRDTFLATDTYKTINGWNCRKWVPQAQDIGRSVAVWVSNEVPTVINMGVLCDKFEGGVVAVEWTNGRYNQLEKFELKNDYVFDKTKLRKPTTKNDKIRTGGLRSALNDDYKDSFRSKIEHK